MKILAYTETYASETVTFITNELASLQEEHDLMLIYSIRRNAPRFELKNMKEAPFKYNRIFNKVRWWLEQAEVYFWMRNKKFGGKINSIISEFKPDIIHCHFGTDFLKLIANLNDTNKKIPILISFYGYDVTERIKNNAVLRQYQKYLCYRNVYSIAVSNSLIENVMKTIHPFNQILLLPSGIDTEFYNRKQVIGNENEYLFIQVSSFYQKKGHKYTLIAYKKFLEQNKKHNYKFIIAGFGPLEDEIKQQVKELNIERNVIVMGPITPEEMVELGSRANCFVQMSITADNGDMEGLPNVLLEAMALELPIVSTNHAGIPDIVENGVNGILCDEKNVEQYVAAFEEIVNWEKLPKNREKIIELFSLKCHMRKLNDLYKSILK